MSMTSWSSPLQTERVDFQAIFEASPVLCVIVLPNPPAFTIVAVSNAYLKATNTTREYLMGKGLFEAFPENPADPAPEGERNLRASLERVLITCTPHSVPVQKYDVRRSEKDGGGFEERYWSDINVPVMGATNEIEYIIHRVEDVTDLIRHRISETAQVQSAEELRTRAADLEHEVAQRAREIRETTEALTKSEQRFRQLAEANPFGMVLGDLNGGLSYINPFLLNLLGYTEQEVVEEKVRWDQLTPPEYAAADRRALQELRERGRCTPYEKVYLTKDGSAIPVLVGASMIYSSSQKDEVAVFVTVLTPLKEAEEALRRSEKLAAVGRLASSISHEINNPLESVTNLLYLLREHVEQEDGKSILEMAELELGRVSEIVTQTLRFHRQSTRPSVVNPAKVIDSLLLLYRGRLVEANVKVEHRYVPRTTFLCYEGEIRQVFANLIGNGIDAMRDNRGGHLYIRVRPAIEPRTGTAGVRVTVADTGHGMRPETASRIFEPFFTTKGNTGTGLGLWVTAEIIAKHGGRIMVKSKQGENGSGTAFAVFFPFKSAEELARRSQGLGFRG